MIKLSRTFSHGFCNKFKERTKREVRSSEIVERGFYFYFLVVKFYFFKILILYIFFWCLIKFHNQIELGMEIFSIILAIKKNIFIKFVKFVIFLYNVKLNLDDYIIILAKFTFSNIINQLIYKDII
jgi:hypothetical protein